MKLFKKSFAVLAAASGFLAAVPAQAQTTTISFTSGYSTGEPITTQFANKGITFESQTLNNVFGIATFDGEGVSNTISGNYPTTRYLDIFFTHPASKVTFIYNNEDSANTATSYSVFGPGGKLLGTVNNLSAYEGSTPITLTLSGISELQFSNGEPLGDSWTIDVNTITFTEMFLFDQFALTPNQHAVARALDFANATNNPGIQNLVGYLNGVQLNYLPATFDMISGEEYTSIYDTAYSIAHLQNNAIFNHLAEIHAGAPGFSMGLVSLDMAAGGKTSSDGKEGKTVIQPTQDDRWGFFATANGDLTDIGGDGNASGFEYATEGLTMGADYRLLPGLVAGTYLGYEHSFTSLTNGGSLDQNGITGGLYSSFFSHGFYLNGIVGGGYSGFTARRLSAGGFTRGDGNNTILNAATSGGYDMHSGPWTFGPQAGLEYDDVGLQSFTENGSLAPLSVGSQSEDSLRSTAGAHVSYTTQVGGVTVRPDVHAAWQHEYDNTADSLGAQIAGTNAVFVVQGPNLGRDSVLAGAGVTVEVSDKTSISLDYEGQFGRTNESQSDLSLGFQTKF